MASIEEYHVSIKMHEDVRDYVKENVTDNGYVGEYIYNIVKCIVDGKDDLIKVNLKDPVFTIKVTINSKVLYTFDLYKGLTGYFVYIHKRTNTNTPADGREPGLMFYAACVDDKLNVDAFTTSLCLVDKDIYKLKDMSVIDVICEKLHENNLEVKDMFKL